MQRLNKRNSLYALLVNDHTEKSNIYQHKLIICYIFSRMCDLSMWNLCVQRKIFYYDVQLEILLKKKKRKKDMHDKRYRVWKQRPKKRRVYMQIVIF